MHESFSFNFPLREYFFLYSPPPPQKKKFPNGSSLMSLRQNGFRNLAKLASWSHSAQVKGRKAPSNPSWPRFCCLRCLFQKNVFFFCFGNCLILDYELSLFFFRFSNLRVSGVSLDGPRKKRDCS